jgi:hypothetical protein
MARGGFADVKFDQTQEPDYNFVLPHRNPLQCSIRALALLLHYIFDQQGILEKLGEWDWYQGSTWHKVNFSPLRLWPLFNLPYQITLLFGRKVGEPCNTDTLRKMYKVFLKHSTVKSKRILHLLRKVVPTQMEDMG